MLTVYPDRLRRDIAVAVANASVGGKLAAGYAALAQRFPSGSIFRLIRSGSTVFQCTTTAPPTVTSGRLRLSKVYGAPTVLSSADIDTGTWRWTLSNGDYLCGGTVGPSAAPYILTGDLATTKGFSFGDLDLVLDSSLDASSGSGIGNVLPAVNPSGSMVDGWITMMTMSDQGQSRSYSGQGWANQPGQIFIGSAAGLSYICSIGGGDIMSYGTGLNGLTTWNWADTSVGHVETNNELQIRGLEAWVLKSNNQWEMMWSAVLGTGYEWTYDNNLTSVGSVDRSSVGPGIRAYGSGLNQKAHEMWPLNFIPQTNASLMQQAKCWHVRALLRVAKVNASGPDNRAGARYRFKPGFDVFNTSHPHFAARGSGSGISNPYKRPEQGTMPGYCMDGGTCSWTLVPFDPANPDAWYSIATTSFTPGFYTAGGARPEIAPALGLSAWDPLPSGLSPYAISHNDFRANPPPLPT